jgi:hypothetical protein
MSKKAITTETKPLFKEVIAFQTTEGFWQDQALATLQKFFKQKLPAKKAYLCTLAALVILETFFADKEGEWQLMAQKAR